MGIEWQAPEAEPFGIWPDNVPPVRVFMGAATQWNVGMAGRLGLRYEALPMLMRYCDVSVAEEARVFAGVQVLEAELLRIWAEERGFS